MQQVFLRGVIWFGLVVLMSELGHLTYDLLSFCEPLLFRYVLFSSPGLLCPSMTWRKITDHLKLIMSNCFCEGLVDFWASFTHFFSKIHSTCFFPSLNYASFYFFHTKFIPILGYYYHISAFICHKLFLHYLMTAISSVLL